MATAQVLPNSRKQEHLEAGKRRLEEFRRKKAAEKAKKPAPSSQLHTADASLHEKLHSEAEHVRLTDPDGAGTSDVVSTTVSEPTVVTINNEIRTTGTVQKNGLGSSYGKDDSPPFSGNSYNIYPADPMLSMQTSAKNTEFKGYDALGSSGPVNYSHQDKERNYEFGIYTGSSERFANGIATDKSTTFHSPSVQDDDNNFNQYSYYGLNESLRNNGNSHSKDFEVVNPSISHHVFTSFSSESCNTIPMQNKSGYPDPVASGHTSINGGSVHHTSVTDSNSEVEKSIPDASESNSSPSPDTGEGKHSTSVGHSSGANSSLQPSEPRYTGSSFDARISSAYLSQSSTTALATPNSRRSRPSFLDSINVARVSSASTPVGRLEKAESVTSKVNHMDVLASSASQNSTDSSVVSGIASDLFRHGVTENMERKHDLYYRKQDEDLTALEQHIEDLTQEKFSLQQALESSRALGESLATENSALTDIYNQQGSVVNQLRSDMEKLQEEIKAQLVELELVKVEYTNAQLECNAADERAKLLASEVIGLEEKALRLRSSELKLERQLENSESQIVSVKKKMSSLEKDRQHLQSTINAMQEEKNVLQSKLQNASASGKLRDVSKNPTSKKDMPTSTEDLGDRNDADNAPDTSNLEMPSTAHPLQPENGQFNLDSLSLNISSDQMRMIQNINNLISECALEKEELMRALSAESSECYKLKELNKELSRKLETQTQRLELLTAQSMAHNNIPARQPDSHTIIENTPYADEGDEVVERVLGWIMKLFPGGPSRRRTGKHL